MDYFNAAKVYANAALKTAPNNSDANFVMSLAMARIAIVSSGKDRIVAVKNIKLYADNAVNADPSNFKAYTLLGIWNYEVSNLNAMERGLAKLLFGGLPTASLESAIIFCEKSRSINPGFVLNYLALAKAYRKNDEKSKAIACLKLMSSLPSEMFDDIRAKKEGRELLDELN